MDRRKFLAASAGMSLMSLAGLAIDQPPSPSPTPIPCPPDKFCIGLDGLMFLEFTKTPPTLVVSCPDLSGHQWMVQFGSITFPIRGEINLRDPLLPGETAGVPDDVLRFSKSRTRVGDLNPDKQALRVVLPLPAKIVSHQCTKRPDLTAKNRVGDDIHNNHGQRPIKDYGSRVALHYTCKDGQLGGKQVNLYPNVQPDCTKYLEHINTALKECQAKGVFQKSAAFDLQFEFAASDPCACEGDFRVSGPNVVICGVMGLLP